MEQKPSACICTFKIVEIAANMYSEMREEARDHARIRNAYFEQVCPTKSRLTSHQYWELRFPTPQRQKATAHAHALFFPFAITNKLCYLLWHLF